MDYPVQDIVHVSIVMFRQFSNVRMVPEYLYNLGNPWEKSLYGGTGAVWWGIPDPHGELRFKGRRWPNQQISRLLSR
jgi:hypothetical protein